MEVQTRNSEGIWRNEYSCQYLEGKSGTWLSLMADVTSQCQLRCRYCYYGEKGDGKMDVNKVFKACVNMAALFGNRLKEINIHYMGGEPLLAWDQILDLNELAKAYFKKMEIPFCWSLTSNLVALDEAKTEHMIEEKALIHCSIDGPADIQDKNRPFRNGNGSFSRVAEAIPRALRINPGDTARVTVCPKDARRMPEIAHEILGRGFNIVGLFPASGITSGIEWTGKAISDWQAGISDAFDSVRKAYGENKTVTTIVKPIMKGQKHDSFSYCGSGKALWAIGMDGMLYFCHHMVGRKELAVVDAASSSIEEIRTAIENSPLPPGIPDPYEGCDKCLAFDFCNGGCWSNNFLMNGSAMLADKSDCALHVATVEAIGKMMYVDSPTGQIDEYCRPHCDECVGCVSCEGCASGCYFWT